MKWTKTSLMGVLLYSPEVYKDDRGYFLETYSTNKYLYGLNFVQSNVSRSKQNVLRGLHAQKNRPQGKLITVLRGSIYDVAVNMATGEWGSFTLKENDQLYIPSTYYHGFYSNSDDTTVEYKCTNLYDPNDEIGVVWNDPKLGIKWPAAYPIVSEKDAKLPNFKPIK